MQYGDHKYNVHFEFLGLGAGGYAGATLATRSERPVQDITAFILFHASGINGRCGIFPGRGGHGLKRMEGLNE